MKWWLSRKKKKILRKKLEAIKLLTEWSVFSIENMCLRLCRQRPSLKRAGLNPQRDTLKKRGQATDMLTEQKTKGILSAEHLQVCGSRHISSLSKRSRSARTVCVFSLRDARKLNWWGTADLRLCRNLKEFSHPLQHVLFITKRPFN